jgi:hypothetical protein
MIASAVCALLGNTACGGDDKTDTGSQQQSVRCQGINECAGHGECSSPGGANACQGQNACKGQGWITVDSEQECTDQGGTVLQG